MCIKLDQNWNKEPRAYHNILKAEINPVCSEASFKIMPTKMSVQSNNKDVNYVIEYICIYICNIGSSTSVPCLNTVTLIVLRISLARWNHLLSHTSGVTCGEHVGEINSVMTGLQCTNIYPVFRIQLCTTHLHLALPALVFELSYISSVTDLGPINHVLVSRPLLPLT